MTNKRDALVKFEITALRRLETCHNDHQATIEALTAYSGQDADYVNAIMYGADACRNAMILSLDPNREKVIDFYEVMKANGDIDPNTPYQMEDQIDTLIYFESP